MLTPFDVLRTPPMRCIARQRSVCGEWYDYGTAYSYIDTRYESSLLSSSSTLQRPSVKKTVIRRQ